MKNPYFNLRQLICLLLGFSDTVFSKNDLIKLDSSSSFKGNSILSFEHEGKIVLNVVFVTQNLQEKSFLKIDC